MITTHFRVGDRVFSHYTMSCGRIVSTDDQGWHRLIMDNEDREMLDDSRLMSLSDARRRGYIVDPV